MSKHFKETMENGEKYYENGHHNYAAKMMNGEGFAARIDSSNRTYFIDTIIDEGAEMVIMEISPCIYCNKESRSQVGEYVDKINTEYKSCNIRIASNGNLYIHAEQRFDDGPLSVKMFRTLEFECIKILDTFEIILDKLAHIKLLEPDEADVEKVIAKHFKHIKMKLTENLLDELSFDEDDDADEDDDTDKDDDDEFSIEDDDDEFSIEDDDDEFSIADEAIDEADPTLHDVESTLPDFSEWLRRRSESGDPFATKIIGDRSSQTPSEDGYLLKELLSISADNDDDDDDDS